MPKVGQVVFIIDGTIGEHFLVAYLVAATTMWTSQLAMMVTGEHRQEVSFRFIITLRSMGIQHENQPPGIEQRDSDR